MTIDSALLDSLTAAAKASPRLRMNLDLRKIAEDSESNLQKMQFSGLRCHYVITNCDRLLS